MEAVDSSGQLTFGTIKDNYDNEYRGEILNGQANGFGTKTYKDGRVFKGKFKDNKDLAVFDVVYTNEENLGNGSFKSYWNKYYQQYEKKITEINYLIDEI